MEIPPGGMALNVLQYLELKSNASKRIIDPNTGHQYEIGVDEVNYHCPICQHIQKAPAAEQVDYQCPKCKWAYKVQGDMLVLWHPSSLGIDLEYASPGYNPFSEKLIDAGGSLGDQTRAEAASEFATDAWLKARANNEEETFGKKIQILTPGDSDP